MTAGLDGDFDAGQLVTGFGDELRRLPIDVLGDPHEVERRARVAVDGGVDLGGIHRQERAETGDHLVPHGIR